MALIYLLDKVVEVYMWPARKLTRYGQDLEDLGYEHAGPAIGMAGMLLGGVLVTWPIFLTMHLMKADG